MTCEDLAARWTSLRRKLIDGVRPPALQAGLRSPWVAGIAAGVGAFIAGYLLGRRAIKPPAPAPAPASEPPPAPAGAAPTGESALGPLLRRLAVIGLEALEREMKRRSAPRS